MHQRTELTVNVQRCSEWTERYLDSERSILEHCGHILDEADDTVAICVSRCHKVCDLFVSRRPFILLLQKSVDLRHFQHPARVQIQSGEIRSVYVVLSLSQVVPAIVQSVCGCIGIDRPSTTKPLSELNLNALGIENAVIFKPPPIIQLPPLASQHEAAIRRRAPHLDCCEAL